MKNLLLIFAIITTGQLFGQQVLPQITKTIDLSVLEWMYSADSIGDVVTPTPITAYKDAYNRGYFLKIPDRSQSYRLQLQFKTGIKTELFNQSILIENFVGSIEAHLNQILIGKIENEAHISFPVQFNMPLLVPDTTYTLSLHFHPPPSVFGSEAKRLQERGLSIQLKNNHKIDWTSANYLFSETPWFALAFFVFFIVCVFYSTVIFQTVIHNRWLWMGSMIVFLSTPFIGAIHFEQRSELTYHVIRIVIISVFCTILLISNYTIFSIARVPKKYNNGLLSMLSILVVGILGVAYTHTTYIHAIVCLFLFVDIVGSFILVFSTKQSDDNDGINRRPYILFGNIYLFLQGFLDVYAGLNYLLLADIPIPFFISYFIFKSTILWYLFLPFLKKHEKTNKQKVKLSFLYVIMILIISVLLFNILSPEVIIGLFILNSPLSILFIYYHTRSMDKQLLLKQADLLAFEKERSLSLENEVQKRTQQLNETVKNREDLLQIIAHDFRGQVVSIYNFLHLLAAKGSEWAAQEQTEFTNSQIRHVHALHLSIDNTLMWGITQKGALVTSFTKVNVSALVSMLLHQYEKDGQAKHISFDNHIETNIEQMIDEMHLTLAIRNLLSNSLKYAPQGSCIIVILASNFLRIINEQPQGVGEMRGTGIGLSTTEALLTKNNCRFNIVFNPKVEATIFFS